MNVGAISEQRQRCQNGSRLLQLMESWRVEVRTRQKWPESTSVSSVLFYFRVSVPSNDCVIQTDIYGLQSDGPTLSFEADSDAVAMLQ